MAITATLSDDGPTTTITFDGFELTPFQLNAKTFVPIAYPENEGQDVIFVGQWEEFWIISFYFANDASWPGSGDSAADKRKALVSFLKSGGDAEWLFTLTFNSEDSTEATPVTEVHTGKVKNLRFGGKAGDETAVLRGEFEFWTSDS